jgi:hypothetical protein
MKRFNLTDYINSVNEQPNYVLFRHEKEPLRDNFQLEPNVHWFFFRNAEHVIG